MKSPTDFNRKGNAYEAFLAQAETESKRQREF